ncbi:unnamed protein product, partial [Brachionus calyciflorus]
VYAVAQPYIVQNSPLGYSQDILNNNETIKNSRPKSVKDDQDDTSEYMDPTTPIPETDSSRKLLVGFHHHYDKATEIQSLQCCTCCIGCWRNCCDCCSGCENFISCPIYCWLFFIMPIFIILIIGIAVSVLYAAKIIK